MTQTIGTHMSTLTLAETLARRSDPITSTEAADVVSKQVKESRFFVWALLADNGPMADHEMVTAAAKHYLKHPDDTEFSDSRLRTARHELAAQNLVEEAGYYHLTPRNRRAMVWQVVSS
jgi:hypothetical protein